MTQSASGGGDAHQATVDTSSDEVDEAALEQGRQQGAAAHRETAQADLAAAKAKVEHTKTELAGAEQAVTVAQQALDALDKGN